MYQDMNSFQVNILCDLYLYTVHNLFNWGQDQEKGGLRVYATLYGNNYQL